MKRTLVGRDRLFAGFIRAPSLRALTVLLSPVRKPSFASAATLFLLTGVLATNIETEGVLVITEVMVTDDVSRVPDGFTGVSEKQVTLPYIPGQVGERVSGSDVNRGVSGTTTSIWVKYERLPEDSAKPVLADIEVRHWVDWKVSLPGEPGWTVANGTSAGIRGALTTRTKGSVWRNGLAVRYLPLKDADSRIVALYLSVSSSSTPSQPLDVQGKAVTVQPAGVDIHRGGGGNYFFLMKYIVAR